MCSNRNGIYCISIRVADSCVLSVRVDAADITSQRSQNTYTGYTIVAYINIC
jgi:hypothetical protein